MASKKRGFETWHLVTIVVSCVAVTFVTLWTGLPTPLIAVVFGIELVYFAFKYWV